MPNVWRIHIDLQIRDDESLEDALRLFDEIGDALKPIVDPHLDDEDCVRYWHMGAFDVSDEYEDVDDLELNTDDFVVDEMPEDRYRWN